MKNIFIFLILFGFFINDGLSQTSILKSGKYFVDYSSDTDTLAYRDFHLIIKDSTFIQYTDFDTLSGIVKWLDDKSFKLQLDKRFEIERTGVLKMIHDSFGDQFFEILSDSIGRYEFRTTYEAQLHITANEGTIAICDEKSISSDTLVFYRYACYNDTTSILLPTDYIGPKYYFYEEGSIISFYSNDLSIVSILCGANARLSVDSSYLQTNRIQRESGDYFIHYYRESKDQFACQCKINGRIYLYEGANLIRKKQLDKVFEIIENKKKQPLTPAKPQ